MLCAGNSLANSFPPKIAIVTNNFYKTHALKLANYIKESKDTEIEVIFAKHSFEVCSAEKSLDGYDLIVSLGRRGLQTAVCSQMSKSKTPIYSLLISKSHYKSTIAKNAKYLGNQSMVRAFFIDQEIHKHVGFLKTISKYMDEPLRAGVLLGNNTKYSKEELMESAHSLDVNLDVYELKDDEEPANALKAILENHNLILALPDYGVFDKHNARGMLMLAFANRVPVVGYTRATTEGGGLTSLYSPKYKQIKEAAIIISDMLDKDMITLPENNKHPSDFSVAVNATVKSRLMPNLANSSILYNMLLKDLSNE